MIKHTQTIRRLTNCLSVFDHFVGLALKGLTIKLLLKNVSKREYMVLSLRKTFTEKLAVTLNDDASNVYLFLYHSFFFIVYHSSTSIRESSQLYAEDLHFMVI